MLQLYKSSIRGQYEASLAMIAGCVQQCPDDAWDRPVANHLFCQSVFHALFFADLYLGPNVDALRQQPFHRDHADFFGTYEELENQNPKQEYARESILEYLTHCREKAIRVVDDETDDSLSGPSGFSWLDFTRAELHPYNIRHVQHHAAQLSLRLRLNSQIDVAWCKTGWPS